MNIKRNSRIQVFCCYARKDLLLLDELKTHLSPLEREGRITIWADSDINAGTEWQEELHRQLNTAQIILLLISPDFVASDYCYGTEMLRALERHKLGEARVIPIILRPVSWKNAPFSKLQVLPQDAKPITSGKWHHQDDAFYDVVEGVRSAVEELLSRIVQEEQERSTFEEPLSKIVQEEQERPTFEEPLSKIVQEEQERPTFEERLSKALKGNVTQTNSPYEQQLYTALDIGTAYAKAIIVEVYGDQAKVLGVGRHQQNYTHMSDGIVTDIPGVIANCNEALLKAQTVAGGIIAPSAIIGIAGELVKCSSITVSKHRQQPSTQITAEELEALITIAQNRLLKAAKERIAAETGYHNIDVRLTNTAVIFIRIDGQVITNPIGFKGRHFSLTLFSAFAPLMQLTALETVVQGLGLIPLAIVANTYALAGCLSIYAGADTGAIFIDIGAGTTDIALVRQGNIEEGRMFALGGRAFTRRIATSKGMSLKDAERLKINYSNGDIKGSSRNDIQAILAPECQTWMDSVEFLIEELAKGELLPPAIYIVGGGSALIDIHQRLESFPWTERLPFSRQPIIRTVQPDMVASIIDREGLLLNEQDIIPMALAYQAIKLQNENNLLERALDRVRTAMHINLPYEQQLYTVLDIGTVSTKAMIIEVQNNIGIVRGVGQHQQNYTHMSDGIVTDIPGVISCCNEALLKAQTAAGGIIAPSAIIGIAGELVKCSSITVSKQRQQSSTKITTEELEALITEAQERLLKAAKERIAAETGYHNTDVRLINTAVISVSIDGQVITNLIGSRGLHFSLTLFSAFAPLMQLTALETVVQGLGLIPVTIVANAYALARCLSINSGANDGAIFIDIGGDTTDIALVREGKIEEVRIFAIGGRTFTHRIATSKGILLKDAERLKINYSNGDIKGAGRNEIQAILAPECQTWMDIVEFLIEELAKGELLPPAIYIVGGGSALIDIHQRLESFPWTERLPFSRQPIIRTVQPDMVASITDHEKQLRDAQDVTSMALAYQAVELHNENNILKMALDRVRTAMHI